MTATEADWSHLCLVSESNDDRTQRTAGLSLTSVASVEAWSLKDRISTKVRSRMLGLFGPTDGQGD